MNNINNPYSSGEKNILRKVDFYRKVPKDLTEASTLGASMSVVAALIIVVLFLSETLAFARSDILTSVSLDDNVDQQIRINFNITFFELHCDYVSVDVWDSIGTNRQNVTKNIEKWQLDASGVRRIFSGRNREVRKVQQDTHRQTLQEMHDEEGKHVINLDDSTYDQFLEAHEMAFINFYAPWCIWCQRLHPTWEMYAREVYKLNMPVGVANVNCQDNNRLCQTARVMAFPTVRWFHGGQAESPDYRQDRTLNALVSFTNRKLAMDEKYKKYKDWEKQDRRGGNSNNNNHNHDDDEKPRRPGGGGRPDFPGCQVSGHLMANRVPGNFLVLAKSNNHNLNAALTNLSHRVNHLSFGDNSVVNNKNYRARRILKQVPDLHKQFNPVDNRDFITKQVHQAWHHYIKVVSTHLNLGADNSNSNSIMTYQMLEQSQIVKYKESDVPQARFSYDISPMSVVVKKDSRRWYDYVTSLCAIIGGSFTTMGLLDGVLYKVMKPKIA